MGEKTDLVIAIVLTTLIMAMFTVFIIYFMIVYRRKQRAFEWERQAFRQALLATQVEIKEQTLSDISRELHDNFGQIASLVKINLNMVSPEISPEDRQKITDSLELLKMLINDIKSLSVSLKGENLTRFGLVGMIEKDIERYRRLAGLEINFVRPVSIPVLKSSVDIFLYRMFQEIFNNIFKHSYATQADVRIEYSPDLFRMSVHDNGKGFNSKESNTGSGLINLKERCQMIGAKLDIRSSVNEGTFVIIDMKL